MGRTIKRTEKTENGIIAKVAHYDGEWVAEITGTDPKYKFARRFLEPEKDWSSSGKTGWSYYELENGKIYQVNEPYYGRYFVEIDNNDWYDIEEKEILERLQAEGKAEKYDIRAENEKQPPERCYIAWGAEVWEEQPDGTLKPIKYVLEDPDDEDFYKETGEADYLLNRGRNYVAIYKNGEGAYKVTFYLAGKTVGAKHETRTVTMKNVRITENTTFQELYDLAFKKD